MTHEQAHALLLDLAYGELAPEELGEVARHAAECSACAGELDAITATRAHAARLGDVPGPARARSELVEAARRGVSTRPARRWWARPGTLSFAAAAVVVAVVTGVTLQLTGERVPHLPPDLAVTAPEPARPAPPAAPDQATPVPPASGPTASEAAAPARPAAPRRKAASGPSAAAPRVDAPETAGSARKVTERPAAPSASDAAASPQAAPTVDRRLPAGGLTEERRELRCGGVPVERIALLAGGRVVQVTERRGDGAVLEAWYDDAGHLRTSRVSGGDPGEGRPSPRLPTEAPTLEALSTSCGW